MKRANGSGSIKKLSGKRRKPFAVLITVGYTDEGKQLQNPIGYFAKRVEAEAFLADYLRDPSIARKAPTLTELYEQLIRDLERQGRAEKTLKMYRTTWTYFTKIADRPITDLRKRDLSALMDLHKDKSYSTLHKIKVLASQLYKQAMDDDYVSRNIAKSIVLPPKPTSDTTIFTDAEVEKILRHAATDDWAKIIAIMIYTLMRPSELLSALKFNAHISERYLIAGGKTKAGTDRIIPIHTKILPIVQDFMQRKSEYLISIDGEKVTYNRFLENYTRTLQEIGIKHLTPKHCRKTGATMLKRSGADELYLTRIIGHTDIATTDKYYIEKEVAPLVSVIDMM